MNKTQKQTVKRWIKALRSGKFPQIQGQLNHPEQGYCCLGVLCEIQKVPKRSEEITPNYTYFQGEVMSETTIPNNVIEKWTGVKGEDDWYEDVQLVTKTILMKANDTAGLTFNEIADLLDIYLLENA